MKRSLTNPLNDAFSWLVVVLGIIAGALSQFPEIWPFQTKPTTPIMPIFLVRVLILPVIILV